MDSKLSTRGGYRCCSRIAAAASAASRQWAVPVRTTPRKLRSGPPPRSALYGSALSHRLTASGVRRRSMTRRSAVVNTSAGGTAGSVAGSRNRFEIGNEFGRRPGVARVHRDEPAVGGDDRRAQVVRDVDRALGCTFGVDAELLRERCQFGLLVGEIRTTGRVVPLAHSI